MTLIELLAVIAIFGIVAGFVILPVANINRANTLSKAASEMMGCLESARAHAMANNTYVWVGFAEVDAMVPADRATQTAGPDRNGRVAVAMVASRDGTRDVYPSGSGNLITNGAGRKVDAIAPLKTFENVHMTPSGDLNGRSSSNPGKAGTGGMERPEIKGTEGTKHLIIASDDLNRYARFGWPLEADYSAAKYKFEAVVCFDPSGVARVQTSAADDSIGQYIEIGLRQTRGNAVIANDKNIAAIQVDCITGVPRLYRP